jgi:hypothetical protein
MGRNGADRVLILIDIAGYGSEKYYQDNGQSEQVAADNLFHGGEFEMNIPYLLERRALFSRFGCY